MNCQSCRSRNLDDAEFCSTCGVKLAAPTSGGDWLAGMVTGADDAPGTGTGIDPSLWADAPTPTNEQRPTAALDATAPPPEPPPAPGAPARSGAVGVVPTRRSSMVPVAIFCVLVAIVAAVAAIVISRADDEPSDSAVPGTLDTVGPNTAPIETTAPSAAPPTAPSTAQGEPTTEPTVDTTVAETTSTTTTITTTASDPGDPAAVPPVPDEPGPVDAPGSPQVLANVLPSGLSYTDVRSSFELAQAYGDALALEDWDTARELAPNAADNDDAFFESGYGATNRISLMLVDATEVSNGHRIISVSVALENGGTQTSLYCLTWDVDPDARTVQQIEGRRIARWATNAQPEAIRNDPDAMATVNSCTAP